MSLPTALVLDEHLLGVRAGLEARGIVVRDVADFGAKSIDDPEVMRSIARKMRRAPWVLVTMDSSILDDYRGFEWERYAIAWVMIDKHARGIEAEQSKHHVVQRHAHLMVEQKPGDHFAYDPLRHYKHPPSLVSRQQRMRGPK